MEVRLEIRKGRLVCSPVVSKENATTAERLVINQKIAEIQVVKHVLVKVAQRRNLTLRLSVITAMKRGTIKAISQN